MVQDGLAWHYKKYSSDKALAKAETKAKEACLGLWKVKAPVPPWKFRHSGAFRITYEK